MQRLWAILVLVFSVTLSYGQDTLPDLSVKKREKGKPVISWRNQYPNVRQLTIQRSPTGKNPYKSILTLPDPNLPENGFMDVSAPHDSMYYRLYILLDSGKYVFSTPQKAVLDTSSTQEPSNITTGNVSTGRIPAQGATNLPPSTGQPVYIKVKDSLAGMIYDSQLKRFRDSVLYRTKDTLLFLTKDTLQIRPFVPKEVYRPSLYVFTGKDGNVQLSLPPLQQPYKVRFFEFDTNDFLFELEKIKAGTLILDKANFIKSGWYWFELFEGDKFKERHKLYIPKDF